MVQLSKVLSPREFARLTIIAGTIFLAEDTVTLFIGLTFPLPLQIVLALLFLVFACACMLYIKRYAVRAKHYPPRLLLSVVAILNLCVFGLTVILGFAIGIGVVAGLTVKVGEAILLPISIMVSIVSIIFAARSLAWLRKRQ